MATMRVSAVPELAPMRVAQISSRSRFRDRRARDPEPNTGHVRIKVQAVAFATVTCSRKKACGREFSIRAFQDTKWAGIIDELGDGVSVWKQGSVSVSLARGQDNTCRECRRGDFRIAAI